MKVYLATGNPHKCEEFGEMIHKFEVPVSLKSANEVGGMPEVEETGDTLHANARLKGEALLKKVPQGSWVLADDTGLLVDALDGAPGVHSARFAGLAGNAVANNIKLLQLLKGLPLEKRTARFSCVLFFAKAGMEGLFFEGTCEGHIMAAPSGVLGFGYDPLFQPLGYNKTFADLGSAVKNSLSHRGRAVAEWARHLQSMMD
ncbi:MAG TPA: RdgB/HAM1 family non-canonical purine NTP pyrophosphatase [Oceanipulchritudo sp.]|nr:RdgB/HAM1 family non-canonical purine NTP pyrophosphatase [Oceanipulchritudo sp.]